MLQGIIVNRMLKCFHMENKKTYEGLYEGREM